MAELEATLREARERIDHLEDPGARPPAEPVVVIADGPAESRGGPGFLAEELASILSAAQAAAGRMVERGREHSEARRREADRMWRQAREQWTALLSWQRQLEPRAQAVRMRIQDVRGRIVDVPGLIRQTLGPLAEAVASVDGALEDLGIVASPPSLAGTLPDEPSRGDRRVERPA